VLIAVLLPGWCRDQGSKLELDLRERMPWFRQYLVLLE
jgi:hypothetical protein